MRPPRTVADIQAGASARKGSPTVDAFTPPPRPPRLSDGGQATPLPSRGEGEKGMSPLYVTPYQKIFLMQW